MVAHDLVEQAGGGRVTERHILHLIDMHAEHGGAKAVALLEEVGESLLRFQASRPISVPVVPVAPAPLSTPAPVSSRRTPSQPFVIRPEDRAPGELQPPVIPRTTPPEQPVVSFTEPDPSRRPPSAPRPVVSRQSGVQFRCPRCRVMVVADENLACPRCGQRAPRLSGVAATVARRPAARAWVVPATVLGVAVVVAVALTPMVLGTWRDRSEGAGGTFVSTHLGVTLELPAGWRHVRADDWAPGASQGGLAQVIPDAASLRGSRFFRDRTELVLLAAARPSQVTEAAFGDWASSSARAPETIGPGLRDLTRVGDLHLTACEVARPGLRCAGQAGAARAFVYIWPAHTATFVAVVLTRDPAESAATEADELVRGLGLG